jgi:hypothetical protein
MKEMLKEVNGRRFRVDQPSQTLVTFDEIHYHSVSAEGGRKKGTHIDNVQRDFFEHQYLFVYSTGNAGLARYVFISNLGI